MNINKAFPSNYLKADDLEGDTIYTIKKVVMEKLGQGQDADEKPVVYFRETDLGFACNKTNANTIAGIYGPETEHWTGKTITLFPTQVEFAGNQVAAIRVRIQKKPGHASHAHSPAPTNGSDIEGLRKTAKMDAWNAFKSRANGQPLEQTQAEYRSSVAKYFGDRQIDSIAANEWGAFASDEFIKKQVDDPFANETKQEFTEADIPF